MKVELLISRAAASGSQNRGDIVEVSDNEAARMIEAGQAKPVRGNEPKETAVLQKRGVEKASK